MMICPSQLSRVKPEEVLQGSSKIFLFRDAFEDRYRREFSYTISDRDIIVDDIRVRATGLTCHPNIIHATGREGPLQVS